MRNWMAKLAAGVVAVGVSQVAFAAEVDRREERQEARIQQGIRSGELTPREAARLQAREQSIHNQVAAERAANGGKLTRAERRQVNRRLNRTSRAIAREKHD